MDNDNSKFEQKNIKLKKLIFIILIIFFVTILYVFLSAPFKSEDVIIHVKTGQPVSLVVKELKEKNVIRNDLTFKLFIKLLKKGNGIIAGDYLIEKKSPVWVVAWQLGRAKHNIEPIKVTIREGITNTEIANLLDSKLYNFNRDVFVLETKNMEGYLFPDTYFFFPQDSTEEIVEKLSNNFKSRIRNVDIENSSKSLSDLIIMASILEGEANGKEDIKIISGILWKRISLGMPLQVDVDKNTYETKGLPVAPLNNPGLLSIESAINPVNSSYLYYLHDKSGNVHYAINFEEHKNNINKYLK